jgi:hypothetical protein
MKLTLVCTVLIIFGMAFPGQIDARIDPDSIGAITKEGEQL